MSTVGPPVSSAGKAWQSAKNANKKIEYPSYNRLVLLCAAEGSDGLLPSLTAGLFMLGQIGEEELPLAMSRACNELLASRLARAIDSVRVPDVSLGTGDDDDPNTRLANRWYGNIPNKRYALTSDYFIKAVRGGLVLSERVRGGLPISFLTGKVLTSPRQLNSLWYMLDKPSPLQRHHYDDFPQEAESDQNVLDAASWDSEQRLATYAFRALLGCGYPHCGNTLVDRSGHIWIVDHATVLYYRNQEDIKDLASLVARSERVMGICRRMSAITTQHIEEALDGIPAKFWEVEGVLSNKRGAVDYFCKRAAEWRLRFGVEPNA